MKNFTLTSQGTALYLAGSAVPSADLRLHGGVGTDVTPQSGSPLGEPPVR